MTPDHVFTAPKFHWSRYLQRHLAYSSVNVSDLHPIMGLRLAALFIHLTNLGLADNRPGFGLFQISSGVRSYAQQVALYNDICLRQGRCTMVANPHLPRSSGADQEGVLRFGSNHMAQRQSGLWSQGIGTTQPVEVGYAVDIRNTGTSWDNLHRHLDQFGLVWPLKGSPYEPWHIEAFPDRSEFALGWAPGPWPRRPGVHRPLFMGAIGGDVRKLQRQLGIPKDARDGRFGQSTRVAVRAMQHKLGIERTGIWATLDQRRFERQMSGRV
jgi:Putative peptidoglycan binding domain